MATLGMPDAKGQRRGRLPVTCGTTPWSDATLVLLSVTTAVHDVWKRRGYPAGRLGLESRSDLVTVSVLGDKPVVLGDGGLGAPWAALVVEAGDRDAGLSRGPVMLELGDRSRLRP